MTVAEMLVRMSSAELTDWKALYEIEYNESKPGTKKTLGEDD